MIALYISNWEISAWDVRCFISKAVTLSEKKNQLWATEWIILYTFQINLPSLLFDFHVCFPLQCVHYKQNIIPQVRKFISSHLSLVRNVNFVRISLNSVKKKKKTCRGQQRLMTRSATIRGHIWRKVVSITLMAARNRNAEGGMENAIYAIKRGHAARGNFKWN